MLLDIMLLSFLFSLASALCMQNLIVLFNWMWRGLKTRILITNMIINLVAKYQIVVKTFPLFARLLGLYLN